MNFADQATFQALLKRIDELEARLAVLEAKKSPGRPPKQEQQAA